VIPDGRPRRRLVEIDTDACVGSATCVRLAHGLFALGDDGKATVVGVAAQGDDQQFDTTIDTAIDTAIDEAAEYCPVSAITRRPAGEGGRR
jgi:ferredoxin